MRRPKILVLAGSNRSGSFNGLLAGAVVKSLAMMDCEVTRISLRDYEMPLFDADLEKERGQPANAVKLARLFHEQDGIALMSPEYNTSITPLTKNTIDWLSRVSADDHGPVAPFAGKVIALGAASPGNFGGMRSLLHVRSILVSLGALVISEQVSVPRAREAFDSMEALVDESQRKRLDAMCRSLVEKATLLATP